MATLVTTISQNGGRFELQFQTLNLYRNRKTKHPEIMTQKWLRTKNKMADGYERKWLLQNTAI